MKITCSCEHVFTYGEHTTFAEWQELVSTHFESAHADLMKERGVISIDFEKKIVSYVRVTKSEAYVRSYANLAQATCLCGWSGIVRKEDDAQIDADLRSHRCGFEARPVASSPESGRGATGNNGNADDTQERSVTETRTRTKAE